MITLKIQNNGEVQKEAFTLLGASTKRDDDKSIGMFGSGNKYALAHLLKNGHRIKIFSGQKEIVIGTRKTTFDDHNFDIITVNGDDTSITTDTGPGWELWQAIREIYSNAMDEGLTSFEKVDGIESGEPGTTTIFIQGGEPLLNIYNNMERYFIRERPFVYKNAFGAIYEAYDVKIGAYHKGIRALESDKDCLFDYNLFKCGINESRLFETDSKVKSWIWNLWLKCDVKSLIKHFLESINNDVYENNTYLNYWNESTTKISETWRECLEGRFVCPASYGGYVSNEIRNKTYFVPYNLYKIIIDTFGKEYSALKRDPKGVSYVELQDPLAENTIKNAVDFFGKCGMEVPGEYQIVYAKPMVSNGGAGSEIEESTIMGLADKEENKIVVCPAAIQKGTQATAETIFEEWVHLKHNVNDKTRAMQDVLIREFINYVKVKNAYNL